MARLSTKRRIFHSIVGSLFYGEIEEKKIFPYPTFSEEQKEISKSMIDAIVRFATENIDSAEMDDNSLIPKKVIDGLASLGLCGLAVPEEYGGMELDHSLYSRIFSEIGKIDGSIATLLGAHQSIGFRALLEEGNEKQKTKWLPLLSTGKIFAAFCLTEAGSGSDAYSIKTKAKKNDSGNYVINGQKLWITNAGMAKFYSVFCKTDHEIDGKWREKISCFIVEGDREGISFGDRENKMGIRASETRAVYFDNVIVPPENILGDLGKGFKIAMNVLNSGRLSLGSCCIGAMKGILELATRHATTRIQFNRPISEFGLIQDKLASIACHIYNTESIVYMTTGNIDKGMNDCSLETAICKIVASEALWSTIDMGMQIAGGTGYMKEYPFEKIMRDSRINLVFEGTNEILRCFLALSGMRGPSEDLKKLGKAIDVSKALQEPIKSLGILSHFAKKRFTKMIGTRIITRAHHSLKAESLKFSSMLSKFSIEVENCLMKYGKTIIDHELPQKRISNMVIELYISLSLLSRSSASLFNIQISEEKRNYILSITRLSLKSSRSKFIKNLKEMNKHSDVLIEEISKKVCEKKGIDLDIIDF